MRGLTSFLVSDEIISLSKIIAKDTVIHEHRCPFLHSFVPLDSTRLLQYCVLYFLAFLPPSWCARADELPCIIGFGYSFAVLPWSGFPLRKRLSKRLPSPNNNSCSRNNKNLNRTTRITRATTVTTTSNYQYHPSNIQPRVPQHPPNGRSCWHSIMDITTFSPIGSSISNTVSQKQANQFKHTPNISSSILRLTIPFHSNLIHPFHCQ